MVFPDFRELGSININFYFSHFYLYTIFLVIYWFCFMNGNLYKRNIIITRYRHAILIIKALMIGSIVVTVIMVFSNSEYLVNFGTFMMAYFLLCGFPLLILFRVVVARRAYLYLIAKNVFRSRVLIVGGDELAEHAAKGLEQRGIKRVHGGWLCR